MASITSIHTSVVPTLVLLALAALLSYTFHLVDTSALAANLQKKSLRRLKTFHAIAIESTQLLLAILILIHLRNIAANVSATGLGTTIWRTLACSAHYTAAIFAVDIIENLVILQTWKHPAQAQTFLLTRKTAWPYLLRRRTRGSALMSLRRNGNVVICARKRFNVPHVNKVILLQTRRRRSWSDGGPKCLWEDDEGHRAPERKGGEGEAGHGGRGRPTRPRSHSFPHEQLNTRPLLLDARCNRSAPSAVPTAHASTQTAKPAATSFDTSGNESDGARGRVKTIVRSLERGRRSRETEMDGSRLGERSVHVALKRWRCPGKTI